MQETKVPKDHEVKTELPEMKVPPVLKASQVIRDPQEQRAVKVHKVKKVLPEPQSRENQDNLAIRETRYFG